LGALGVRPARPPQVRPCPYTYFFCWKRLFIQYISVHVDVPVRTVSWITCSRCVCTIGVATSRQSKRMTIFQRVWYRTDDDDLRCFEWMWPAACMISLMDGVGASCGWVGLGCVGHHTTHPPTHPSDDSETPQCAPPTWQQKHPSSDTPPF
jgi:hypothetical protein